nr:acyl-protein thioesterase 1 [Leptinotarsa decemlineata]
MAAPAPVVILATAKHTATLIFLHGLGDTGIKFLYLVQFDEYPFPGIKNAAKQIHSLIEKEESAGIPSNRVLLGGFSMGGALAIYSSLTYPKPLAGVVGLSCWLPLNKSFPQAMKSGDSLPILQCHGDCDPVVPVKWGQMTASLLKTFLHNSTEFKLYRGLMHTSSEEELEDIRQFVSKHLSQ